MSAHQKTTQAVISGTQTEFTEHQGTEKFELFVPDGNGGWVNLAVVLAGLNDRLTDLEGA